MRLFNILDFIYNIVLISALILGILRFKKLIKPLRIIFLFVVFGCLTEITIDILKIFGMRNTSPVGNNYFPLAFLILGLFYFFLLKDYINKRVIIGTVLVFIFIAIFNLLFIQDLKKFPNIIAPIGALIIIVFSILHFLKVLSDANIESLSAEPLIWINTIILIYYSANLFYFTLFNLSWELNREFTRKIHLFYAGVNILFYAFIAVGFWKVGRKEKNKIA